MAVNATAVWRVRPSGNNTNGGGYDAAISGAGTDYSQQDAAQATGTNGVTTGTTNFADTTANAFTSAMIGNAIYITGTGQTTGFYFVTAFVDVGNVTLDRSPGTGTGATWKLGGGWANFWTNTTSAGPTVAGNIIYVLGSGTPNPSSYSYDYTMTTYFIPVAQVQFHGDPSTPGYKAPPDTTGGMPVIKTNGLAFYSCTRNRFQGLWFAQDGVYAGYGALYCNTGPTAFGCVYDQRGNDQAFIYSISGGALILGCEMFSSVVPGAPGTDVVLGGATFRTPNSIISNCNIHDTVGPAISAAGGTNIINNIISKCPDNGIKIANDVVCGVIMNNTIDGNTGHGIYCAAFSATNWGAITNNIISNHTVAGKYGINLAGYTNLMSAGSFCDYNVFYNNTADISPLAYGPHDTHGGSNPYVGQATEDYKLA